MKPMNIDNLKIILAYLMFALTQNSLAIPNDPESWLRKADEIRNPSESYFMQIAVESENTTHKFDVYLLGNNKTLIVTKEPAINIGRNMLMVDQDFYAYIPNLKRAIRLSLAQKLTGLVANGDIARTRWYQDYKPTIISNESDKITLSLEAQKNNLTYQKIKLVLDKTHDGAPLLAEYLSADGKLTIKTAYFEEYGIILNKRRPRQIKIVDKDQKSSVIKILSMEPKDLKNDFFTQSNLERIK
ncbi:MAG: outer membrane lipoprotein-sorting protein [Bdellovibrionaceae bacterium]|nr:outer membrane lipoprotein-sorting protein [Pseudobdellovibrionaceae bacterium]MDW8189491.1 outer membrane lipoprotein-sorting protein [Pseudobdellovibrionaceae bacterium]